jgi:hypothetical protein
MRGAQYAHYKAVDIFLYKECLIMWRTRNTKIYMTKLYLKFNEIIEILIKVFSRNTFINFLN